MKQTTNTKKKKIKKLKKELKKLKESNEWAWKMYGSELCADEMYKKEQEILNKIRELEK